MMGLPNAVPRRTHPEVDIPGQAQRATLSIELQHRRSMVINDTVPPIPDMVGGGIIVADWEGVDDH